jgi:hypothetical protein
MRAATGTPSSGGYTRYTLRSKRRAIQLGMIELQQEDIEMSQQVLRDDRLPFWQQYKERLVTSFNLMDRDQQESVIRKNTTALTVGFAVLFLNAIYGALPALLRVLGVPLICVGSYYAGRKLLTPFMIKRLERHMKPRRY